MARSSSESTSDLYIRLGLSAEELESGFVNAERTIRDNMTRLSRENTIVDLQAQVEILGLDETADATRILEIRQRALQRQIDLQRDRVRLASAELRNMTQRTGENSDQTQRAALAHERERVALARLEQQMRELNETQSETAETNEEGIGGLDDLVDGVLDKIPPQAKAAAGAIAGIGAAMIAAGKASADLIRKWGELQKQAYELNMSVNDTKNFLRKMTLAGGDIEDFKGFIRGISDAMVKGEFGDPEELVFRRYGESAFDAKGRLKNFQEMTETIERMYEKAKAAGEEIEFLQMLGGESGVTDAIEYLERHKEAEIDAAKIFDAGLDPEDMHESSRALNLLTMQVDEFTDALTDIITPATTEAFEDLFEIFHEGTRILSENKEEIRDWGDIALDAAKNALLHSQLGMAFLPFTLFGDDEKKLDKQKKKLSKTTKSWADFRKEQEKAKKSVEEKLDPLSQYGDQRARDLEDEIADLRIAIDYENEYQRAVATAQLERERALRNINMSARERAAVEKKYLTDIEQATKDHNDKIEEMERETAAIQFETSHSAFEKEIYDIEQWKNKALEDLGEYSKAIGDKNQWVKEAAAITENALAKEAKAYEEEIDRIKGKTQSLAEKIFEQEHSQRDADIMKAQKERAEMLEEGLPEELVSRWYKNEMAKISMDARKSRDYRQAPHLDYSQRLIPANDFWADIQSMVDDFTPKTGIPDIDVGNFDDLTVSADNAADALSKIPAAVEQIQQPDTQNVSLDISPTIYQFDLFNTAINNASINLTKFGVELGNYVDSLNKQRFSFKPQDNSYTDNQKTFAPAQNFLQPKIDNPDFAQKLKNATLNLKLDGRATTPNFAADITPITQELVSLTQTAGAIAADLKAIQQKENIVNINVNPNISIDLGGAYVFDDQMKIALTDDIGTNIANSITDAVTKANNQGLFGFNN